MALLSDAGRGLRGLLRTVGPGAPHSRSRPDVRSESNPPQLVSSLGVAGKISGERGQTRVVPGIFPARSEPS